MVDEQGLEPGEETAPGRIRLATGGAQAIPVFAGMVLEHVRSLLRRRLI